MIEVLRGVKFHNREGRELWLYPKVCLVGYRMAIPAGEKRIGYQMDDNDFMSGQMTEGEVAPLKSATIIVPGGEVWVHNDQLEKPSYWKGCVKPIVHGVHVKGNVMIEGIVDSVMHCVSPRNNMKGYHDKRMERVHLDAGEGIVFGEGVIGFVVVYGEEIVDQFPAYLAEAGDSYTAQQESILAVSYRKEGE